MEMVEKRSSVRPQNIPSDRPMIDIIVPFFNAPIQYTRAGLESIRAQTYPRWRVIVVNDGSSEESTREIEALIRSYNDARILYRKTENRGPAGARNAGIRLCSGDWIAFLDADDYWTPDKLDLQMAEIARHPEVGMVACEGFECSPDGEVLRQICLPHPFTRKTVHAQLKLTCIFTPSGAMIRRDIFQRLGGFAEDIIGTEDYEMFTRIAASYEIGVVHRPLFKKIALPQSLYSNPELVLHYGLIAKRRARELLGRRSWPGSWLDGLTLRRAEARTFLFASWMYAKRKEKRKSALNLIRGLLRWPFLSLRACKSAYWLCKELLQN